MRGSTRGCDSDEYILPAGRRRYRYRYTKVLRLMDRRRLIISLAGRVIAKIVVLIRVMASIVV
jgi:hypothetical protein